MGLDNGLYGIRPNAKRGDVVTFANWRKNWDVHSLLEKAFDGKDEGGFMFISLDTGRLEQAVGLLRGNPYLDSQTDLYAFERALEEMKSGRIVEVVYEADW